MEKIEGKKTKPKRRTPIKVLLAKIGLDGHDRGIKVIAQALRDAGFEVIYLGIHNSPEEIVRAAIQEDPRAIGISIHSAAHMVLFKKVLLLLKKQHADEIKVFGGGIIPEEDKNKLLKMGVISIFTPGASMKEIVSTLKKQLSGC